MAFLDIMTLKGSSVVLGFLSTAAILTAACSQANTGPQTGQQDSSIQAGTSGTSANPISEASISSPDATPQPTEGGLTATDCLSPSCHGSFEKVEQASSNYVTPSGIAVDPHRTVDTQSMATAWDNPHLTGKDIIQCSTCHKNLPPMPPASADAVPNANIDYCYGCHHTKTFESCKSSSCHPNGV
jgi:hypothetical protein